VTAPTTPTEQTERLPWTAAMLRATHFTRLGRGGKGGYDPAEVDDFHERVVAEAVQWEKERSILLTEREAAREALRQEKDTPKNPPSGAVQTMMNGQAQIEGDLHRAQTVMARQGDLIRRMRGELEAQQRRLDAVATARSIDLPDPPQPTGDPVTDLEARTGHLQACAQILDERSAALDEERHALDEQRQGFVELLDRLEAAVPDVRAALGAVDPVDTETPAEVA
jgi:DNA repair exonuclease SbcCD ATPase subunit